VTVVPLIVVASIASLNVMFTAEFTATLTAPLAGDTDCTVGGMLSAVMKVQTLFAASALPKESCAPVVIVAV